MFPNGAIATPEKIRADFPAIDHFPHVLEINGNVCGAIMELSATLNMYDIDTESKTEAELIKELEDAINTQRNEVPEDVVTTEERIAIAYESLAILQTLIIEDHDLESVKTQLPVKAVSQKELDRLKRNYEISPAFSNHVVRRLVNRGSISEEDYDYITGKIGK
jgi:hypothetical protein